MKKLILKYLTNSISDKELNKLRDWLSKRKNQEKFKDYISDDYNLNSLYDTVDTEAAFIEVWNKAQRQTKVIPFYKRNLFKYVTAASIALLVSITLTNIIRPIIVSKNIETGTDKAILTLEDGTNITLEKGQEYITKNIISNGEAISYKNATSPITEVVYNYLTIPRGGQYYIKLEDDTQVWLNSESQLKYPVNFIDGKTRSVELVYGEAYFDVSPSSSHDGSKFIVSTKNQGVEVIGTEFNIKAYEDESHIYTTLVEGKIRMDVNSNKDLLSPNQQFILNKSSNDYVIVNVDTSSEVAWKKGLFSFKNKNLKEITKVLSRWYNVDFLFEDKDLEKVEFKGVLSKNQNIEEILILIQNTNFINAYEINNNTIILKN